MSFLAWMYVVMAVFNFAVLMRGLHDRHEITAPVVIGMAMLSLFPLMTIVLVVYWVRRWFARHWEIMKIEEELRAK